MPEVYLIDVAGFRTFALKGEQIGVNAKLQAVFKILLVDDEMLVRAGTAMMLDELGHDVTEAVSGKMALEKLAEQSHYDIIISDFRMPDMDGKELIQQARTISPDLKAILMTGYDADDPRFAGLVAGSLSKPFGLEDLEQALISAQ